MNLYKVSIQKGYPFCLGQHLLQLKQEKIVLNN